MPLVGGAHPEFGDSVNTIPTRGADYALHITACPPEFENLAASLIIIYVFKSNPCCRNLIFLVVQKSLTNLNPYQSCLVLFFACFFCCASGPVEHMGTVGICLTQLAEKKFLGENCAL